MHSARDRNGVHNTRNFASPPTEDISRSSISRSKSFYSSRESIASSQRTRSVSPLPASGTRSVTSISSVTPHLINSENSPSDAVEHLKARIRKRHQEIRQAFQMFDSKNDRCILKSQFRLVLDTFCFPLSDTQFRAILKECKQAPNGTIHYGDFMANYKSPGYKQNLPVENLCSTWTVEEIERKIKEKTEQNVKAVCAAFRMLDRHQDGNVQCSEMKKMLENFCDLKIGEDAYHRLWAKYDPKDTGLLDYKEFLKKLSLNVSQYQRCLPNLNMKIALTWPEANMQKYANHKRRIAILTRSDDPSLQGLPLEHIVERLQEKIIHDYSILKSAFLVLDPQGTGTVPGDAFHSVINHFTFPLSKQLFLQLMPRLGINHYDKIGWRIFLDLITDRYRGDEARRIKDTNKSTPRKSTSSAFLGRVLPKLIHLGIQPGLNVQRVFNIKNKIDGNWDTYIPRQELRLMIERKGNYFTEGEIKNLLVTLDPGHTNLISYTQFCNLFGLEKPHPTDEKVDPISPENFTDHLRNTRLRPINLEKLTQKLKEKIHKNFDIIEKTLGACDYEQMGWVTRDQLRQVLHKFCFRVTDEEFEHVLRTVDAVDNIINIRRFLTTFRETERERLQKWSSLVSHLTKPSTPHPWTEEQLQCFLNEVLKANRQDFITDLQNKDPLANGCVSKHDFRCIANKHLGRLSPAEFEILWHLLPKDNYGNLKYVQLFEPEDGEGNAGYDPEDQQTTEEHLTAGKQMASTSTQTETKSGSGKLLPVQAESKHEKATQVSRSTSARHRNVYDVRKRRISNVRPTTAIVGAANADFRFRKLLAHKWVDLKQRCQAADKLQKGTIPSDTFLDILGELGAPVYSEELQRLLQIQYNVDIGGTTNYVNFLKDIFLNVQSAKKTENDVTEDDSSLYSDLLELRIPVLSQWSSLKKAFRKHEILANGYIEVHRFRKVLRDHDIQPLDDNFSRLVKYLDPHKSNLIRHNDFLKIFMKSAA